MNCSKFCLISALLLFMAVPAQAQQQTLLSGDVTYGGYGGPAVRLTTISSEPGLLVGGRGGALVNFRSRHSLAIGGGGYGLVTHVRADGVRRSGEPMYIALGYGGLIVEYVNRTDELVHWKTEALIGAGGADHRRRNFRHLDELEEEHWETFFVFEPSLGAELNVTTFFRIGLEGSYRLAPNVDLPGVGGNANGLSAALIFKFGSF